MPEALRPLINIIPLGDGLFTKPVITPGWDTAPNLAGDGIFENRKGGPETKSRVELCGKEAIEILESFGYKVDGLKPYGGEKPQHYYPNPAGGTLQGGAWGDRTIYATSPEGERVTLTFNTYTARADGTPITQEIQNAEKLVGNWLELMGKENEKLSDQVRKGYEWLKGAFAMISKGAKGPENDEAFRQECRKQILSLIDENGRLNTRPQVPTFGKLQ